MTKEMKRPTSHISGNSIKPALSKAVEFYTDNNRQAYDCIHERDEYIDYLESKLSNASPQQALLVVPEDVAKWIEDLKSKGYSPLKNPVTYGEAISDLSDESLEKILTWISQHQEEFMRAWLDGYTVEKPQLFYLKNKLTNSYLCQYPSDKSFYHLVVDDDGVNKLVTKFTKQEIDSMQTGSYELVPVEDGE